MNQSPMFLALLDGEDEGDADSGGHESAPAPDFGSEDELDSTLSSSLNSSNRWAGERRQSDASDSSVSVGQAEGADDGPLTAAAAAAAAAARAEAVEGEALTDEAGLILATRTLEISLEADDELASAPSRSVERGSLTGLIGTKMVRHLKPASTDTSRTAPLPRRCIPNRSSTSIGRVHDARDVVPRMNEAALVVALERAKRLLEERGMDAAQDAHEALLQVEALSFSAELLRDGETALGAARRVLHAARAHSPIAATIVVHYARWSENEKNAAHLCSGDGLEVLLALLAHRPPAVREPACKAFANLCSMPHGAAALGDARTVERLCGAVRAQLGRAGTLALERARSSSGGGGGGAGGGGDAGGRDGGVGAGTAAFPGASAGETAGSSANIMRGLKKLALSAEGRLALAMGGALQLVTEVSRAHPTANAVVEQALRIIGNVAIDPEREETIVESGCVQLLCTHLSTSDPAVLSADAGALANLISNPLVRSIIVANGCIRQICDIVAGPMGAKPEVYKHASWLLTSLAVEHESRAHVLTSGAHGARWCRGAQRPPAGAAVASRRSAFGAPRATLRAGGRSALTARRPLSHPSVPFGNPRVRRRACARRPGAACRALRPRFDSVSRGGCVGAGQLVSRRAERAADRARRRA